MCKNWFLVCSLWGHTLPPSPGPLHLPLPADVIPGSSYVLHRPTAPTAGVWGSGGHFGCLPAAHETASVGLLDMADDAVTESNHRGKQRAPCVCVFLSPSHFSCLWRSPGLQTPQPFVSALLAVCGVKPLWQSKREKCFIPEICSFHFCMYIYVLRWWESHLLFKNVLICTC